MKNILIVIVFSFTATLSYENVLAQGKWHWQNPAPFDYGILNGVSFPTDSIGFAVGYQQYKYDNSEENFVLKTTDQGETWKAVKTPGFSGILNGVDFIDSLHGWIIGNGGYIAASSDGGITWNTQQSNTKSTLNDLKFVSSKKGWAVGDSGTIVATTNGGVSWFIQSSIPGNAYSLRRVSVVDSLNGWAISSGTNSGIIIKTTNGGTTWTQIAALSQTQCICFVDKQKGWVGGYFGVFYMTTDGGVSWVPQATPLIGTAYTSSFSDITFQSTKNGFVVGGPTSIQTTDGGTTWIKANQPPKTVGNGGGPGATSVCLSPDGKYAICVGSSGAYESYSYPYVGKISRDSSKWISLSRRVGPGCFGIQNITFADSLNGYAVGVVTNNGSYCTDGWPIVHTTDGGTHWFEETDFVGGRLTNLYSVFATTPDIAWAGGEGKIFKRDQGAWEQFPLGSTSKINDIFFLDKLRGFYISDNGEIFNTTNGGDEWDSNQNSYAGLLNITFVNKKIGWISGKGGTVLVSHDTGRTWVEQNSNVSEDLHSISFIDSLHGWAGGSNGVLIATTNGGATWGSRESPTTLQINSIVFIDTLHGWLAGNSNEIFSTSDAGVTWVTDEHDAIPKYSWGHSINKLIFLNRKQAWLCAGTGSAIMKYEPPQVGEINLSSGIIDYSVRTLSTNNDTTIVIKNTGEGLLNVSSSLFSNGAYYSILSGGAPFTIKPDSSHLIAVRYHPTTSGILRDTLVLTSNGDIPVSKIAFVGRDTVVKVAEVGALPELIDYKKRTLQSDNDTTITVKNAGNAQLNISSTAFINGIYYSVVSGGAPFNLDPDSTRDITLRYHPTFYGIHNDTLVVTSNGIVTVKKIAFTGHSDSVVSNVEETISVSKGFWLMQNHPNPFSQFSIINYHLSENIKASLEVRDVLGRVVYQTSADSKLTKLVFNASGLSNGLYLYSLTDGKNIQSRMMMVLR